MTREEIYAEINDFRYGIIHYENDRELTPDEIRWIEDMYIEAELSPSIYDLDEWGML